MNRITPDRLVPGDTVYVNNHPMTVAEATDSGLVLTGASGDWLVLGRVDRLVLGRVEDDQEADQ